MQQALSLSRSVSHTPAPSGLSRRMQQTLAHLPAPANMGLDWGLAPRPSSGSIHSLLLRSMRSLNVYTGVSHTWMN